MIEPGYGREDTDMTNHGQQEDRSLKGRYCMVTGASSGIGREIALGLARRDAKVFLVCRDPGRGRSAQEYIRQQSGNDEVHLLLADLSAQKQVKDLAADFMQQHGVLHLLVNNAGVIMGKRVLTEDGIEMTFAVNYLACFLLTNLLLGALREGAPSKIVNLTTSLHRMAKLDFDNLQGEKSFGRDSAYGRSKLAVILFTYELAMRLEGSGITVNCVCPGACSSGIWSHSSRTINAFFHALMKGPEQGAVVPLHLACSSGVEGLTGRYFETKQHLRISRVNVRGTESKSSPVTYDRETAARLWKLSERLTGLAGSPRV
jgi:NAD(P)-dependent dehydrogenase (short-subunit alcohol dehydrogenase family)